MMLRASAGTARRAASRIRPSPQLSQLSPIASDSNLGSNKKEPAHHVPAFSAAASFSSMSAAGNSGLGLTMAMAQRNDAMLQSRRMMSSWNPFRKNKAAEEAAGSSETTIDATGDGTTFSTGDAQQAAAADTSSTDVVSFGTDSTTALMTEAANKTNETVQTIVREGLPWEPDWYWPPDMVIDWLNYMAEATGMPYAMCIAGTTLAIRVAVFPLFVTAQRNQSRMAHMKPELDAVKAQIDRLGPKATPEEQMKYGMKMKQLFQKYECNPLKSLAVPFIQAPVFMSMFFGLRKMPDYFPNELANGGMYWFPDLTAADPYHIMPIASAAMFIGMMEIGKEQMLAGNPQQGPIMLNAFRGLGLIMVPITWNFTSAIFCYWCTNNLVSFGQAVLFKNAAMRKTLGIWDPPPPVPGMQEKPLMAQIKEQFEKSPEEKEAEKIRLHNEAVDRRKAPPAERQAGRNRKKRGGR